MRSAVQARVADLASPVRRRSTLLVGRKLYTVNERRGPCIGVFDSGIGGLSILKALRAELPQEDFIYIADSGHAPYGEKDESHVLARSRAIVAYLAKQNVKALVIACNTATAAAIHLLRAEHPGLALVGVEPALKPAVACSRTGCIGVLATRGLLSSDKFKALLAAQAGRAKFLIQPCDGLADAIERSAKTADTAETIALCACYTNAIGSFGTEPGMIDTLVLGCTHYPFASDCLRPLVGAGVQLIDNGEAVARQTRRLLTGSLAAADQPQGRVSLFTTGPAPALQAAALRWMALSTPIQSLYF